MRAPGLRPVEGEVATLVPDHLAQELVEFGVVGAADQGVIRGVPARGAPAGRDARVVRAGDGEDDDQLRGRELSGSWDHLRRAASRRRPRALRSEGGGTGPLRVFKQAGAEAVESEKMAIERTSPQLASLVSLAEAVDHRKDHRLTRVARCAEALARHLRLPEEDVERVRIAALLRDVGEVGVAESILSKPGALDPRERHEASGDRSPDRRDRAARAPRGVDPHAPRASGRPGLPARTARAPDPAGGPDRGGRGRVRCVDRREAVSAAILSAPCES